MPPKKKKSKKKELFSFANLDDNFFPLVLIAALTAIIVGSCVYWFLSLTYQTKTKRDVREKTSDLSLQVEILENKVDKLTRDLATEKRRKVIEEQSTSKGEQKSIDKETGYISAIYQSLGNNYIDVDFVYWLTGEEAVEAAIEDTGCARDTITSDECAPSLADGYYVRNQFSDITTLTVPEDTSIELLISGIRPARVSFEEFVKLYTENQTGYYSDAIYNIYSVDDNIIRISQQYQP